MTNQDENGESCATVSRDEIENHVETEEISILFLDEPDEPVEPEGPKHGPNDDSCPESHEKPTEPIFVTRYNVAASHCFLYMTLAQVLLYHFQQSTRLTIIGNICFHVMYTTLYAGFLVIYYYQRTPLSFYTTGVALYTAGYAVFEVYFWLLWSNLGAEVAYISGSLLFLIGSTCLVQGTWRACCKYACFHPLASLFYGSLSFLVGSILFSLYVVIPDQSLVARGLEIFCLGRVFFLHGSSNENCNVVFRPKTTTG